MPRWEPEQSVSLSFLDRLIDLDPKSANEGPPSRAKSVRQLKTSLRRDLEWLLNTRRRPDAAGSEFRELEKSLFNFGLPDITSIAHDSAHDRQRLTRSLEHTLATFEPRLSRIRVVPVGELSAVKHVLRFQIEALLDMDPAP